MKKLLLLSMLLQALCSACSSDNTCSIQGIVTVPDPAKDYYAVLICGNKGVDTCLVENGAFTLKTIQDPRVQQRIKFIDAEGNDVGNGDIFDMMEIVADTREMTVDFNTQQSSGSPLTAAMNDMIHKVYQHLEGSEPEMDDPMAAMDSVLRANYFAHLDDAVGLQAMRLLSNFLNYEEMMQLLDQGADFIKGDEKMSMALTYLLAPSKDDGKVVFVKVGTDGRVLSQDEQDASACLEYLDGAGRDGYVLLDFWASWCGPCREKIPEVIRLYDSFAPKGLKVLGVTVQDKPENSLAAMAKLGVNYDQIFDLDGILCSKFPFAGIPHFFLLDPKGAIVCEGHSLREFEQYLQQNI